MKKFLALALLAILTMACHEDTITVREAFFTFDLEKVASAENMRFYYSSPDPGCGLPKMYTLILDRMANEVILKCNNRSQIIFKKAEEQAGDKRSMAYISYDGTEMNLDLAGTKFSIIDGNMVKIVAEEMDEVDENEAGSSVFCTITLADPADPGKIYEHFIFQRFLPHDIPYYDGM